MACCGGCLEPWPRVHRFQVAANCCETAVVHPGVMCGHAKGFADITPASDSLLFPGLGRRF